MEAFILIINFKKTVKYFWVTHVITITIIHHNHFFKNMKFFTIASIVIGANSLIVSGEKYDNKMDTSVLKEMKQVRNLHLRGSKYRRNRNRRNRWESSSSDSSSDSTDPWTEPPVATMDPWTDPPVSTMDPWTEPPVNTKDSSSSDSKDSSDSNSSDSKDSDSSDSKDPWTSPPVESEDC